MQSRARGGDDLRTTTIDALYDDVDYTVAVNRKMYV